MLDPRHLQVGRSDTYLRSATQHSGMNPQDKDDEAAESSEYESFEDEMAPPEEATKLQSMTADEAKDKEVAKFE